MSTLRLTDFEARSQSVCPSYNLHGACGLPRTHFEPLMATFRYSGSLRYVKHGITSALLTYNSLTEHVYIAWNRCPVSIKTIQGLAASLQHSPAGVSEVCKGSRLQAIRGPLGLGLGNSAPHNNTHRQGTKLLCCSWNISMSICLDVTYLKDHWNLWVVFNIQEEAFVSEHFAEFSEAHLNWPYRNSKKPP